MALLSLQGVTLNLGGKTLLDTADLHVEQGERVCLVGRNGVGKSSLMALLSGDLTPDGGTIVRTPGVTFGHMPQAVPDHWSGPVFGVVASGLGKEGEALAAAHLIATGREDQLSAAKLALARDLLQSGEGWERHGDILEAINQLGLDPEADFATLSGGNKRRVALARAVVIEPSVLLFDEPLSNLDAKLRNQMRAELIKLRQRINTTFIYVTHDQTEAMTLGDRIVIMKDGVIQQIGTPQEVFNHPANLFVAGFIGMPQMNFYDAELVLEDGQYAVVLDGAKVTLPEEKQAKLKANGAAAGPITLGVRPEHLILSGDESSMIHGTVDVSEMMGSAVHLHVSACGSDTIMIVPTTELESTSAFTIGSPIAFTFNGAMAHLFDRNTQKNLEWLEK